MDKKLKILFVSKWLPTREIPFNGVFVVRHAKAVARYSQVFLLDARPLSKVKGFIKKEEKTEDGIFTLTYYYSKKFTGVGAVDKVIKLVLYFICLWKGYKEIKTRFGKPDLTHVHILLRTGIFALFLKYFEQINYIITEHWSGYLPESQQLKGNLRKKITKLIIKKASWVTAVSEKLKEGMISCGLSHSRFSVVPNVIDTDTFKITTQSNSNSNRIIYIADLIDEVKNISGAIKAVSLVKKTGKEIKLDIYGEGKDRHKLQELIKQLKLEDSVILKGEVSPAALATAISESAFLVLFSNFETFSCVIAEAFAAGKPVVATKTGAIPELVKPENGILVDKGNIQQLTDAIITMIDNHHKYDSAKLRAFSVNKFSYEKVGSDFLKIYEQSV